MRTKLFAGVAFAALILPSAAFAQSSGTVDFEDEAEIVVTGSRNDNGVGGIIVPDVPKSRVTVGADLISRQRPGQTVNEIINLVPGVSFQNNDATGAAGGTFTIRGFDSSRISQTLDGIPLNDTGNYAIYSNQQQDPETLQSITVNMGTTDVDSPTASAVGGTVNIRTRVPTEEFGAMLSGTYGNYIAPGSGSRPMFRMFGMVDTGDIAHTGIRAFLSASNTDARQPFNNYGQLKKQQYNARVYKEISDNGDFVSISGQYNENRNNFFGSVPLRVDTRANPLTTSALRIVGPNSGNRFPLTKAERFYNINYPCVIGGPTPPAPTAGAACGTEFDRRYNPSNTGNVRFGSRFTLAEGLIFSLDGSFQYVKANGGGTVTVNEGCGNQGSTTLRTCGPTSYVGVLNTTTNTGTANAGGFGYYAGRDLNGDGDTADSILAIAPSQTQTRRYGSVASLAYEIDDNNRVRLTYTYDRGRHRQTGEVGLLQINAEPFDVFPVNNPVLGSDNTPLQKRNRLSYATLNQVSGEYRGQFLDQALTVILGVRAPFYKRDLNQYCFTVAPNASNNVACVAPSQVAAYALANPYAYNATTNVVTGFAAPQSRTYKYNKVLPNIQLGYNFTNALSMYASYAKGLSVPSTDNLYTAFYYPKGANVGSTTPETSDSFDLGVRYRTSAIQAQLAGWYTRFDNRIVSTYDADSDQAIYRNLGRVDKYGMDASLAVTPFRDLTLYTFASYLHSNIKDNVFAGEIGATTLYYQTAGKSEGGAPEWTFGTRVQGTLGPVDLGVQAKRTGSRFINDENLPVYQCTNGATGASISTVGGFCPIAGNVPAGSVNALAGQSLIYGAKIPAYTVVDLDVRVNLGKLIDGVNDKTFFQLNVGNLFDQLYVGGLSGSNGFVGQGNRYSIANVVIGTPRSIMGSLVVGF